MSLVTIPEASKWASDYLDKEVSPTNISYLVQYGKVRKHGENGSTMVDLGDIKNYYQSWKGKREISWKKNLGNDLNWMLSFDNLREKDTTKHVHRLHPYKGKYIPQLVQYFIDTHTDNFKKEAYFTEGDIILDPFAGSGTTIIQSLEMGIHSIGIDVSEFNCMIASCKAAPYDNEYLQKAAKKILFSLNTFEHNNKIEQFEDELLVELGKFNGIHFPGYDFKYKINQGKFNENKFAAEKEKEFLPIYQRLLKKYLVPTKVDLMFESKGGAYFLFDIKTAKPNVGGFKEFKRTLLEWVAVILANKPDAEVSTFIAIPYNPYEPKPYTRWTMRGMLDLENELKVADEFWDFLGGKNTYEDLLDCFERVGIELRGEIDTYFKRFKHYD